MCVLTQLAECEAEIEAMRQEVDREYMSGCKRKAASEEEDYEDDE